MHIRDVVREGSEFVGAVDWSLRYSFFSMRLPEDRVATTRYSKGLLMGAY